MRVFFTILPIALCVFLPAVRHAPLAEERKQNTWEMVLTFPMRAYEMTLGKFLASMIFYVSALAGTLVLPLMLVLLGSPDLGPIFGAYLGSLLLGAFFLSLGLFISAICRDQIVAFMLTLLGCFGFYLAGTEFVARLAEAAWPGLGSLLAEAVGVTQHYLTFNARPCWCWATSCISLSGRWSGWCSTALFLGIRNRPVARNGFMAALALCLSVGLTTNWLLAEQNLGRIDLTEDELYTLSPASGRILEAPARPRAGEPLHHAAAATSGHHALPGTRRPRPAGRHAPGQRRQLADAGGASANGGRDPEGEPGVAAARPGRSRRCNGASGAGGAGRFRWQVLEGDDIVNKLIYAAIGVSYRTSPRSSSPRVLPGDLENPGIPHHDLIDKL